MNATRYALVRALETLHPDVRSSSGGRTKWNRRRAGILKTHTLDALCVGVLEAVRQYPRTVLMATAAGRGSYARTRSDQDGFPRLLLPRTKQQHGYATGDLVRASVPSGAKRGTYTGRVAVRATGYFNIKTRHGVVQGIHHRYVRLLQRADGYAYATALESLPHTR